MCRLVSRMLVSKVLSFANTVMKERTASLTLRTRYVFEKWLLKMHSRASYQDPISRPMSGGFSVMMTQSTSGKSFSTSTGKCYEGPSEGVQGRRRQESQTHWWCTGTPVVVVSSLLVKIPIVSLNVLVVY
jgi:hypothetical protein